ncbi:MAG: 50S ribosomal protein L34e [Sulfolobales archaeon]|nr:50S ribosomal protein L34e [Sulfolobales archaeon]MDW8083528.1 50S ribosomal protein L34e [Sulfolobales archaeon]
MVKPGLRSRSLKRVVKRVPSSVSRVFYVRSSGYVARCSICGKPLGGVPRDLKVIRYGSKSHKRPERPFGGVLCSKCLAVAYRVAVRGL